MGGGIAIARRANAFKWMECIRLNENHSLCQRKVWRKVTCLTTNVTIVDERTSTTKYGQQQTTTRQDKGEMSQYKCHNCGRAYQYDQYEQLQTHTPML